MQELLLSGHMFKTEEGKNNMARKQEKDKEDAATKQLHSTYFQFSPQLNLASPHQDKTERGDKRTRGERERKKEGVKRHFLN